MISNQNFYILHHYDPAVSSYPFAFGAASEADILVYDIDPSIDQADPGYQTVITAFSVVPAEGGIVNGGSAVLSVQLTAGHKVLIQRATPLTQNIQFPKQQRIYPPAIEEGLDRLTMIAQEHDGRLDASDSEMANLRDAVDRANQTSDSALDVANNAVSTANAASSIANTALNKSEAAVNTANAASSAASQAVSTANQAQAQAAAAVTTANTANANASTALTTANQAITTANKAAQDVAAETAARSSADANLQQQITDLSASVNARFTSVQSQLDNKMPKAPSDGGAYLGAGDQWIRFSLEIGDPFVVDSSNYAVQIDRPAYLPNAVWNIGPKYLTLSESAVPGDGDSVFIADADNYLILR